MPEISLKDYFAKLNAALSANAADEVIHHCRHILQYFPKNVNAYRFLGRALIYNGRWDEGREALRRVLSVIPDDYAAHLGLSEANERKSRSDEAIWHLERAFEQRPNDKDLIEALRVLYRRYRGIENVKIQLTSAAVARQYLRSGAYPQAIDTLRSALARMENRLDLRLLLAQILWQDGSHEEAAEIAIEVLKTLPDCLEANKIMAQLWLSYDRPSDARRYVNRLESVDPYLAVEVVQGTLPDDDAFRLEELDYARSAQSEITQARPDWLQEVSGVSAAAEPEVEIDDDAWSLGSTLLSNQAPATDSGSPGATPSMTSRFAAPSSEPLNTGELSDLFGTEESDENLSALFGTDALNDDEDAEPDPMAWLRGAGVELVDEADEQPSYESLFAEEDNSPLPEQDENPVAWMQAYDNDLLVEDDLPLPEQDENPVAWMQAYDNDLLVEDEPSADGTEESYGWLQTDLGDEFADGTVKSEDGVDWQIDAQLAGTLGAEALGDLPTRQTDRLNSQAVDEALDAGQDDKLTTEQTSTLASDPTDQGVPGPRRGLTAILQSSNLDWMNKQEDESIVSDAEMDDWLNQFGASSEPVKSVTDTPDWLTDLNTDTSDAAPEPENDDDWLAEFQPDTSEPVGDFNLEASETDLTWMNTNDSTNPASTEDDDDWLAEFAPEPEVAAAPNADDFDWSPEQTPSVPVDTEEEPAEEPDWLGILSPDQSPSAPVGEETIADLEMSWLGEADNRDETLLLSDLQAQPAESATWLAELKPDETPEEPEELASADEGMDWLNSEETPAEAGEESEPIAAEETPDWLAELQPSDEDEEAVAEPVAEAGDELEWLTSEETPAEAGEESEPIAAEETPDWLAELQPSDENEEAAAEPVAEAGDDFEWLTSEEIPTEAGEESEPIAAEETPDWLAELQPSDEDEEVAAEPVAEAGDDLEWLTSEETPAEASEESEPIAAEETPDWLAELQPSDEEAEAAPNLLPKQAPISSG